MRHVFLLRVALLFATPILLTGPALGAMPPAATPATAAPPAIRPIGPMTLHGGKSEFAFATLEEGKAILMARDVYIQRLSPLERAAKLHSAKDVSEEEHRKFMGDNVVEWSEADKIKVVAAFQSIAPALDALTLPLPDKVLFIETTGDEEDEAAYTRANAIALPRGEMRSTTAGLRRLIAHELFHVLSRLNPEWHAKLYATIGFQACNDIDVPKELLERKMSNPDAPFLDTYTMLDFGGKQRAAVPMLMSRVEKAQMDPAMPFFLYMRTEYIAIERETEAAPWKAVYVDGKPLLADQQTVTALARKLGQNSTTLLQPEEVLAEVFSALVVGQRNVRVPEMLTEMEKILKPAK